MTMNNKYCYSNWYPNHKSI